MQCKQFHTLPKEAAAIRTHVFQEEQGFEQEFDEIDAIAVHLVLYTDDGSPIGTCRIFQEKNGQYTVGRVAVEKAFRGNSYGKELLLRAENYVRSQGGHSLSLGGQQRVQGFYESLGYKAYGDIYYDEYCPHVHMKKKL